MHVGGVESTRTASFQAKTHPGFSRYRIREFLKAVTGISIVVMLGPFVMFGSENFRKELAVLLTEGIQNLRLNGFLTLIAKTH